MFGHLHRVLCGPRVPRLSGLSHRSLIFKVCRNATYMNTLYFSLSFIFPEFWQCSHWQITMLCVFSPSCPIMSHFQQVRMYKRRRKKNNYHHVLCSSSSEIQVVLVVKMYSCYWIYAEAGQASMNKNNTYGTWQDLSEFLQRWAELVTICSEVGRISQNSFKSMKDWPIPLLVVMFEQNAFGTVRNWPQFL